MGQATHIPLELIPTFLLLADELNISRCARKLALSQPALTRQLQNLEHTLGVQLFVRQSRGLALTESGRAIRKELLPLYEELRAAFARINNARDEISGLLTFGCFSEIGTHLLAPALFEFVQMHPKINLDIRYLSELEITNAVIDGQLDFGIAGHPPQHEAIRSYQLFNERIHLVTSSSNPDIEKNSVRRFAGYRQNDRLLQNFFKQHPEVFGKTAPNISIAVNSHQAMIDAIIKLELYAALPYHSIAAALQSGRLRIASRKTIENQVHLIMPESVFPPRKTMDVVKFLRKKFKPSEDRAQ